MVLFFSSVKSIRVSSARNEMILCTHSVCLTLKQEHASRVRLRIRIFAVGVANARPLESFPDLRTTQSSPA